MPTEAELRQRLHDEGTGSIDAPLIDAAAVISRSRRRRLPRRIAVGTTVTLAVVGIGVAGISGIRGAGGMAASDSAGGVNESVEEDSIAQAPAVAPDDCGAVLTASDSGAVGLAISTDFPDTVTADGGPVTGSVTIVNTGQTRLTGTTPAPRIAIVLDGAVVGFSEEQTPAVAAAVDLGPGESTRYQTSVTVVGCGGSRGGSPLDPGSYLLAAVLDFAPTVVGSASTPADPVVLTAAGEPITVG